MLKKKGKVKVNVIIQRVQVKNEEDRKSEMSRVLTAKSDDYYHRHLGLSGVQSSFDGDSLPDYDEFDSESVTLEYFKERRHHYCC